MNLTDRLTVSLDSEKDVVLKYQDAHLFQLVLIPNRCIPALRKFLDQHVPDRPRRATVDALVKEAVADAVADAVTAVNNATGPIDAMAARARERRAEFERRA